MPWESLDTKFWLTLFGILSYVQKIQDVKKKYFLSFDKYPRLILSIEIATLAQYSI
jgi:hypothetical protein